MLKNLLKKYKEELCSQCISRCENGIIIYTEVDINDNEVKPIICAKCDRYQKNEKKKSKKKIL